MQPSRRNHPRRELPITIAVARPHSDARAFGEALDISAGGMLLAVSGDFAPEEDIVIVVNLPCPCMLPAVVRWSHEGKLGVAFGVLGAREREAVGHCTRYLKGSDGETEGDEG